MSENCEVIVQRDKVPEQVGSDPWDPTWLSTALPHSVFVSSFMSLSEIMTQGPYIIWCIVNTV